MQQGNFNPNWRQDKLGVSAPMAGSGDERELLRSGKDSVESHVRSRFDEKSSFLLMIIRQIGGGTKVIDDFVMNMDVGSQAIDGLARAEYIMARANMIATESMPFGLGRGYPGNNGKKHSVWNKQKARSDDGE
jgi:hypothetical protein